MVDSAVVWPLLLTVERAVVCCRYCFSVARQALCEMGATVGPVDTAKFALDLEGLWEKFNSLDPEAMLAASGGAASDTR